MPVCLSVLWCTVCVAGWENYQGVGSSNEANGSSTRHNTDNRGHNSIGSNKAQQDMNLYLMAEQLPKFLRSQIPNNRTQITFRVVFLHNDWTNKIREGCSFRNRPFLELGHVKTPPNSLAKFKTPMAAVLNSGWPTDWALPYESDPDRYILHFWNLWDETCWELP